MAGFKIKINGGALVNDVHDTGTSNFYVATGLDPSTNYCAQVESYDDSLLESDYGSAVCATTDDAPSPPAVPTGLRLVPMPGGEIEAFWDWGTDTPAPTAPTMTAATGVTDIVIHWNWNAATSDAPITGYDLEIAEDAGFTTGLRTINLGNVTSYVDVHRTPSTTYYARVRATDEVPHTTAYSSSVNTTTLALQFAPTDVADLWMWLDPTDLLDQGLVDGHHVATWNDTSGNNRDATQSGAAEPVCKLDIINSWPVVRFAGGLYHFLNLHDMSALTEGEVFVVLKANGQPSADTPRSGLWQLGSNPSLYTFSADGKIYEGFGSTVRKDAITPTANTSSAFRIYSAYSKSADWQNYINGVSQFSTGTNTVSFPAAPTLGGDGGSTNFDGDIAEFLLYSRKLTGTERTNVLNFLTDKYGL
jgi:hypothetical protein